MTPVNKTKKCFLAPGHPENIYERLYTNTDSDTPTDVVEMMSRISHLRGNDNLHLIPSDVLEQQQMIFDDINKEKCGSSKDSDENGNLNLPTDDVEIKSIINYLGENELPSDVIEQQNMIYHSIKQSNKRKRDSPHNYSNQDFMTIQGQHMLRKL